MKKLSQIQLEAVVRSHRRKLMIGAMIIQIMAMVVMTTCLVGLFVDPIHTEAYCIVFTFFSIIALFGVLQYDKHKRDFK